MEKIRMDDTRPDAPIIDDDGNLMQTSYCWLTRCVCVFATVEALMSHPKDANVPGDHDSKRQQHNYGNVDRKTLPKKFKPLPLHF